MTGVCHGDQASPTTVEMIERSEAIERQNMKVTTVEGISGEISDSLPRAFFL